MLRGKLAVGLLCCLVGSSSAHADETTCSVDYEAFLGQHDMVWDRVPHRWEVSPYTGNGNVGFLFYQPESEAKNTISICAGRHDYYDHRLPHEGLHTAWAVAQST